MRRLLGNLALAATATAGTLLTMELVLRVAGYAPEAFRHTERVANGRRTLLLDCYPTNPRGYFDIDLRDPATRRRYREQGVARVDDVARHTPFALERRYNSARFRGPEIPAKAPGLRRVVVIGDSFTEGMGVREEDVYPRVLHRTLNGRSKVGEWEVLNCGRRGYDFPALGDLFEEVLDLGPDVVVYGMVLNDPEQTEDFASRQVELNDWILDRSRMRRDARTGPGLLESRLASLVRDRLERQRVARETERWYRGMYSAPNRQGWERTQSRLREMNRRMQERGGRLLVALWPLLAGLEGRYPFEDLSQTISEFCLTAGIPFYDLAVPLRGHRSDTLWVHPIDHHPNEIAHRLAAESLAPVIRRQLTPRPDHGTSERQFGDT